MASIFGLARIRRRGGALEAALEDPELTVSRTTLNGLMSC
jgi:hypothetical protein